MKLRTVAWPFLYALGLGLPPVVTQAATAACARLCATSWQLDAEASTDADEALEDALDEYQEEKVRLRAPRSGDYDSMANAEMDESLGPLRRRPQRDALREELKRRLVIPAALRITQDGKELRVDEGRGSPRRFDLDESYSRVDSLGTATIKSHLGGNTFTVTEKYGKGRSNREDYVVESKADRLVVTRTLSRPALPELIVRSIYKPAP